MPFDITKQERADPTTAARTWTGTVTLSSGTATIDYAADLPGVVGGLDSEPRIFATAKSAGVAVGVSSAGTSQATLDDGSGSSSHVVNVTITEQA